MPSRDFTEEEKLELLSNKFTRSVTGHTIKFTDEFNDLFMARHNNGVRPSTIFKDCGYNLDLIGHRRVENYYNRLRTTIAYQNKQMQTQLLQSQVYTDYCKLPPLQAIEAMQTEITYLRQEIDFLKKIISLANKKKSKE